jgi:hypothetical protein
LYTLVFLAILFIVTVCSATGKVLNSTDFSIMCNSTNQIIRIGERFAWTLNDAKTYYDDDRLVGLTVYGSDYSTSRGIKISDSLEKIQQHYGERYKSGERDAYKWVTYEYENLSSSFKIHFYLDKTKDSVVAINLNLYPFNDPPLIKLDPGYKMASYVRHSNEEP